MRYYLKEKMGKRWISHKKTYDDYIRAANEAAKLEKRTKHKFEVGTKNEGTEIIY